MKKIYLLFISIFAISTSIFSQNVNVSGALVGNGTYATLSAAFTAINGGSQTGATILIGIAANITETSSAVLNQSAGPWASLTITPSGGVNRTVGGNISGHLVDLNGADNVIINGGPGKLLTFDNSNTGSSTSTLRFINDATNNTITQTNFLGSCGAAVSGFGVIYFATGAAIGNDNNTISTCNISASSGGTPLNAIYSLGTSSAIDNSGNTITVNNIADYFNAGLSTAGMNVNTGNSGWTITNNSLYQTATRIYTSGGTHYGIQIISGSGYTISNNVIGYANPAATGTTNMIGLTSGSLGGTFPDAYTIGGTANATRYVAINCAFTAAGTVSSIQNNTVGGFALYTSSGAATTNGIFCGIAITSGNVNIGTVTGNIIGSASGTNSIYTACTTTGGIIAGIYVTSSNAVAIRNNTIGALNAMGATATTCGGINGINIAGVMSSYDVSGNIIGNSTNPNLRMGNLTTGANLSNVGTTFGVTTGLAQFNGILSSQTGAGTIGTAALPNTVRNATLNSSSATTSIRGITASGIPTISYNNINNLMSQSTNTGVASTLLAGMGIFLNSISTTGAVVRNNTINSLSLTNTTTNGTNICGVAIYASSTQLYANKIYDITNASTSTSTATPGTASGFFLRQPAGTINIYNNMVSLGNSQTTNTSFNGIWQQNSVVAYSLNAYFNSFNIEGVAAAGAQPSFCLNRGSYSATQVLTPVNIVDNVFTNTRSGGTGKHYAISNNYGAAASAVGWGINASNYNTLNATAATVGYWGADQTFTTWKTASACDPFSLSGITVTYLASPTGDLHLNMGITPTAIESGGIAIGGITSDMDNQLRPGPAGSLNGGAFAPDMGADEFDGVPLDVFAPTISYVLLPNDACTTTRTFTAATTDNSGVNVTVGTRPRVYYKKSTDANGYVGNTSADNGWKYVEASNATSPFSFTINYSIINGGTVAVGDVIQYFVVAQDLSPTVNVAINSGMFALTPTSVALTAAAFPIGGTINSYNIVTGLSTTLTVGAAGNYSSLTGVGGLFSAINANGLTGNTTVNILDASITETGAVALTQIQPGDCSATAYTLLIKPNAGVTSTLTGTLANNALIRILSSNVNIDGSNSGTSSRDLTITNTSLTFPSVLLIGSTGAVPVSNSTVKNCVVVNGATTATAIVVSDAATLGSAGYFTNITIQNNDVRKAYNGIYAIAIVTPGNGSGLNIQGNIMNSTGVNAIGHVGIYVQGVDGATVSGNDVGNFESLTNEVDAAVWFATGTTNAVIEKNNLHDIKYTGVSGYAGKGVMISTGLAAANITVKNNMIFGITGDGDSYASNGALYNPVGIYAFGTGQGGINIYYNSIYLSGATLNFVADVYSIGIALDNNTSATIKNNIIKNELGLLGGIGVGAVGIAAQTSASQFVSLDYNDYYSNVILGTNLIGKIGAANYATLAAWQTATGQEANSLNVNPNFTSSSDLHLVAATNCRLDGYGTPIAGITTDYDNNTRDAGAPDIGADEFTTSPVSTTMASASVCDTKNVSPSGTNYIDGGCNLIARILPSGGSAVTGQIRTCVTLDGTQQTHNAQPYVQRHYDIEPSVSAGTATATVTLYFTDGEFALYNTNNPVWPPLPTVSSGGNGSPYLGNVKVTQFHGVGSTNPTNPGNYPGTAVLVTPVVTNFNGTFWEITFDVTGFSGFYVHTNNFNAPLPVIVNFLTGRRQGSNHLLNWKVTCTSTPSATMTLERSTDARNFSGLYTITADAARCQQPFDYTDVNPLQGMNYYRLKIVDADGKVTYSTTVALLNAVKGFDIISIAPNPVTNGNFKLNVASAQSSKMELTIFDMQGRLVTRQTISVIAGYNSLPVNVSNLSSGTYTIHGIIADDKSKAIRFVKQ